MYKGRFLFLLMALAALAGGCAAKATHLIERYKDVTPARFEGAVAVTLLGTEDLKMNESGDEIVLKSFQRVKIMDRTAMDCDQGSRTCRVGRSACYMDELEEVDDVKSRLITPEGEVIEVDTEDMRNLSSSHPMYPEANYRCWVWDVKGAVPGAIIEDSYTTTTRNAWFFLPFGTVSRDPILEARYTLDAPATMKFRWKNYNTDIQPTEKKVGDRIVRTWEAKQVPAYVPEEHSVSWREFLPWVDIFPEINPVFGKVTTWKDMGDSWLKLIKPQREVTPAVQEVADEIAKNCKTDTDKVRELWRYMNENIRYVARGKGLGGIVPLSAHVVCSKKYGDCKAVGSFISVVSKLLGLAADPVLIAVRQATGPHDPDFPSWAFPHAIARVEADGKVYWLDATARTFDYKTIPSSDQGSSVLVAREGASYLATTPIQPPESNQGIMKNVYLPGPDGSVAVSSELVMTGNYAARFRGASFAYTPDRWKKLIEQMVSSQYSQAEIQEQSYEGKEDNNLPFTMRIKAKMPKALQPAGRGVSFEVKPLLGSDMADYFKLTKRRTPLDLGMLFLSRIRSEVQIPKGMQPAGLPKNVIMDTEWVKVERLTQIENDRVVTEYTGSFKKLRIEPEKYVEARKACLKAIDGASFVLIFEPEKKKKKNA
jgi:hypothetical protein